MVDLAYIFVSSFLFSPSLPPPRGRWPGASEDLYLEGIEPGRPGSQLQEWCWVLSCAK